LARQTWKIRGKVKLSLCLPKHHAMNAHAGAGGMVGVASHN